MASRRTGLLIAAAGVALAVALFLVLRDDGGDEPQPPRPDQPTASSPGSGAEDRSKTKPKPEPEPLPTVTIRGGEPVGGVQELEFRSGEQARFAVRSDTADELHLHGYDLYVDVGPGKPARVAFDADIEGLFELESHSTGVLVAEIAVVPR